MTEPMSTTLQGKSVMPSLTVDDLPQSEKFFTALGFAVEDRWEQDGKLMGLMLRAGGIGLGLSQDDGAKGRDRSKGIGMRLYIEARRRHRCGRGASPRCRRGPDQGAARYRVGHPRVRRHGAEWLRPDHLVPAGGEVGRRVTASPSPRRLLRVERGRFVDSNPGARLTLSPFLVLLVLAIAGGVSHTASGQQTTAVLGGRVLDRGGWFADRLCVRHRRGQFRHAGLRHADGRERALPGAGLAASHLQTADFVCRLLPGRGRRPCQHAQPVLRVGRHAACTRGSVRGKGHGRRRRHSEGRPRYAAVSTRRQRCAGHRDGPGRA